MGRGHGWFSSLIQPPSQPLHQPRASVWRCVGRGPGWVRAFDCLANGHSPTSGAGPQGARSRWQYLCQAGEPGHASPAGHCTQRLRAQVPGNPVTEPCRTSHGKPQPLRERPMDSPWADTSPQPRLPPAGLCSVLTWDKVLLLGCGEKGTNTLAGQPGTGARVGRGTAGHSQWCLARSPPSRPRFAQ